MDSNNSAQNKDHLWAVQNRIMKLTLLFHKCGEFLAQLSCHIRKLCYSMIYLEVMPILVLSVKLKWLLKAVS